MAVAAGDRHSLALKGRTSYDRGLRVYGSGVTANLNRNVTVFGDVSLETTASIYNNAAATIYGRLLAQEGALRGGGTIAVSGIDIQTGLTLAQGSRIAINGPLTGGGRLDIGDGFSPSQVDISLYSASAYTGTVEVARGSALNFTGAGLQTAGALFNGIDYTAQFGPRVVAQGGTVRVGAGSRLRLTDPAPTTYHGNPLTTPGHYNGGAIQVEGLSTAPAELEFVGPAVNATSTGLITGQDARLRFTGGLSNSGSLALTAGLNNVSGDITNTTGATITVTGGAQAVFYDDVVQNGAFRVAKVGGTTGTAVFLGGFTGSGGTTGGGDIFFEGDLRPGNSPAAVTFHNNVSFGSGANTVVELGGTTVGTEYDRINVTGALALDGDLAVSLLGGYSPAAGATFDILNWGSLSGVFSALSLPALGPGLAWNTSELYSTGVLRVASVALAGDYNADGVVDAADYVTYRDGLGTTFTTADYAVWRDNYGARAAAQGGEPARAAVPEPATAVLVALTAGAYTRQRSRGTARG